MGRHGERVRLGDRLILVHDGSGAVRSTEPSTAYPGLPPQKISTPFQTKLVSAAGKPTGRSVRSTWGKLDHCGGWRIACMLRPLGAVWYLCGKRTAPSI